MKFVKKTDMIIIGVILVFAVLFMVLYRTKFSDQPAVAEIYYYSDLVETVKLDKKVDKIFSIPQNSHVVFHLYEDGTLRFEESDCPDKVCINTGKIGMVGQSAACMPNGIVVKIVQKSGRTEDTVDIIVGK